MLNTHRILLIRADGVGAGAGWVTFSGAGRSRKIEVEDVTGLGVTRRMGMTLDWGQDTTGTESMTAELRRAGWTVA
jgi:hypothetical protein